MSTMRKTARRNIMTLTDAAAAQARGILARSGKPEAGLRLGVRKGGCAGLEYDVSLAAAPEPQDEIVEDKGIKLFIAPKAILYLLGTELDYEETKFRSGFVFNNPNQTGACGCGTSVAITPAPETELTRPGGA